jgi:hypothetical protein
MKPIGGVIEGEYEMGVRYGLGRVWEWEGSFGGFGGSTWISGVDKSRMR